MRVLRKYVLIEQKMVKKESKIILTKEASDKDKFDYSFKIAQKGPECSDQISVGDIPLFNEHVRFQGMKILTKDDKGMVALVIVHEEDIIGIDDEENKNTTNSPS